MRSTRRIKKSGKTRRGKQRGGITEGNVHVRPANMSSAAVAARTSIPKYTSSVGKWKMNENQAHRYATFIKNYGNSFNDLFEAVGAVPFSNTNKAVFRSKLLHNYEPEKLTPKELEYFVQLNWLVQNPFEMKESLKLISSLTPEEKDNIYEMYVWHLANQSMQQYS